MVKNKRPQNLLLRTESSKQLVGTKPQASQVWKSNKPGQGSDSLSESQSHSNFQGRLACSPGRDLGTTEANIIPGRHKAMAHKSQSSCRNLVPCWPLPRRNGHRKQSQGQCQLDSTTSSNQRNLTWEPASSQLGSQFSQKQH